MSSAKEMPTSGGNHLAGLGSQNTDSTPPLLAALERIAIALEKSNEVTLRQCKSIEDIGAALYHLKEA